MRNTIAMTATTAMVAFAMLACLPAFSAADIAPANPPSAEFPAPVAVNDVSVVVELDRATVFIDPVGSQARYGRFGRPDIVVLTRAHPDHLSIDTMIGMLRRDTVVLATRSVIDRLPLMISNNVISPFDAGAVQEVDGITFKALSASTDIPPEARVHARDRGEIGVVIEVDGASLYL